MSTRDLRSSRRRGLVATHVLALSLGTVVVGAAAVFSASVLSESENADPSEQELQSAAIVLLERLGITPSALAAAGVTTGEASALISTTSAVLADGDPLETIDETLADARTARDRARQELLRGTLAEDEIPNRVTAIAQFATVELQHDAARASLFEALIADLPAEQRDALSQIARQSAGLRPAVAPYLVIERSSADLIALRDALDAERIAAARDEATPADAAALLEDVRANGEVAAARDASASLLGSLAELWRTAQTVPPA